MTASDPVAALLAEALAAHHYCTDDRQRGACECGEWSTDEWVTPRAEHEGHVAEMLSAAVGAEPIGQVVDWGGGRVTVHVDRDLEQYPADKVLHRLRGLEHDEKET